MWAKDMRRGIDYLETRTDVDTEHLAYYGVSWGGAMGGLMPAVEPRIKVSALVRGGPRFPADDDPKWIRSTSCPGSRCRR